MLSSYLYFLRSMLMLPVNDVFLFTEASFPCQFTPTVAILLLLLSLKADTHYTSCLSYPLWDLIRDVSMLLFGMLPLDHCELHLYNELFWWCVCFQRIWQWQQCLLVSLFFSLSLLSLYKCCKGNDKVTLMNTCRPSSCCQHLLALSRLSVHWNMRTFIF